MFREDNTFTNVHDVELLFRNVFDKEVDQVSGTFSVGKMHPEVHWYQKVSFNGAGKLSRLSISEVTFESTVQTEIIAAVNGKQGDVHLERFQAFNQTVIRYAVAGMIDVDVSQFYDIPVITEACGIVVFQFLMSRRNANE